MPLAALGMGLTSRVYQRHSVLHAKSAPRVMAVMADGLSPVDGKYFSPGGGFRRTAVHKMT